MSGRRSIASVGAVIIVLLLAIVMGLNLSPTGDSAMNAVMFDISPGRGIGSINFGATADEIEAVFGPADIVHPQAQSRLYRNEGLVFYMDRQGRLARFEAVSARTNLSIDEDFPGTIRGRIRIGSLDSEVIDFLGQPTEAEHENGSIANGTWDDLGLTLYFDEEQQLGAISAEAR